MVISEARAAHEASARGYTDGVGYSDGATHAVAVLKWAHAHNIPFPKPESKAVRLACTHNRKDILIYLREELKLPWGDDPLRHCPPYGETHAWAMAHGAPLRKGPSIGANGAIDDDDDDDDAPVGMYGEGGHDHPYDDDPYDEDDPYDDEDGLIDDEYDDEDEDDYDEDDYYF